MHTGLVVVRQNGQVVMKVAASSGGMAARLVAQAIKVKGFVPSVDEAFSLAQRFGFGMDGELVVINSLSQIQHNLGRRDNILHQYSRLLADPYYHPGTNSGISDRTEFVDF